MSKIIDKLILVAGQWQQFGGTKLERQFAKLLGDLALELKTDRQGALDYLLAHLNQQEGVAV